MGFLLEDNRTVTGPRNIRNEAVAQIELPTFWFVPRPSAPRSRASTTSFVPVGVEGPSSQCSLLNRWVDAFGELPPRLLMSRPHLRERNVGIDA
jgi:hypothetical protein